MHLIIHLKSFILIYSFIKKKKIYNKRKGSSNTYTTYSIYIHLSLVNGVVQIKFSFYFRTWHTFQSCGLLIVTKKKEWRKILFKGLINKVKQEWHSVCFCRCNSVLSNHVLYFFLFWCLSILLLYTWSIWYKLGSILNKKRHFLTMQADKCLFFFTSLVTLHSLPN